MARGMNEETYAKRMVERCSEMIVNALQNMSIEDINMYQLGYEKGRADAIDEFIKEVQSRPLVNYFQMLELIDIAEQVKKG